MAYAVSMKLLRKRYDSMVDRCYKPRHQDYPRYGGRGIRVCDRWLSSNGFKNYCADVAHLLTDPELTLDRIDVNGDYTPENIRAATRKEQARNREYNRMLTFHRWTRCVSEWSEALKIPSYVTLKRLYVGCSDEEALRPYLSPEDRELRNEAIRAEHAKGGVTQRALAKKYGIPPYYVGFILDEAKLERDRERSRERRQDARDARNGHTRFF